MSFKKRKKVNHLGTLPGIQNCLEIQYIKPTRREIQGFLVAETYCIMGKHTLNASRAALKGEGVAEPL